MRAHARPHLDPHVFSPLSTHNPPVLPITHTPITTTRSFSSVMNTDIAAGAALRIACRKADLASTLAVVSRAVSTRGAVQVLGGILLQAEGDHLTLAATDMEISIRASLTGEIAGRRQRRRPGTAAHRSRPPPPGRQRDAVVRRGRGGPRRDVRKSRVAPERVQRGGLSATPAARRSSCRRSTRSALLETIEKVGRAASRDESRPVLTGVLVRFEGEKLVMAATDSYRLAVKETIADAGGAELDAIIPARALQELSRLAAGPRTSSWASTRTTSSSRPATSG